MHTTSEHWIERLQMLVARFHYVGIDADISSLTLIDAWALYLHLSRLVESGLARSKVKMVFWWR